MQTLEDNEPLFSLGWCATCGKDVLTHLDYDEAGEETLRCVHCDAAVSSDVKFANEHELGDQEYAIIDEEPGCGRPDCGKGRCGR